MPFRNRTSSPFSSYFPCLSRYAESSFFPPSCGSTWEWKRVSETFFSVVVLPYKAMCAWYSPSALIQTATAQERPLPLSSQREVKKLARYSGFLYSFSSSPMDCMFLIWTVATNARPFVSVENPIMINPPENVVKFTVIRNVTAGA